MIEMIKLDAHQHFWNYSRAEYEWIDESMGVLQRDFLPRDLKPLLDQSGFDGSIAVQARQSLEETRWLLELAWQNDFIRGVVGWVDLCSLDIEEQLREFAGDKRLVGVRHVVQGEPDDRFMLRPEFRRGIARLAEFGLTYDLLLFPRHLPVAVELVREFPGQTFVLDHIAKPAIADGLAESQFRSQFESWARDMRELAKFANVSCKLSGMVTEARWGKWTQEDFLPYLDVVLEAFGPSRLMIGSDWPVCTVSGDYAQTLEIVSRFIERLRASEQDEIIGGNCMRVYGVAS
jgi:L-fuconolactonase